MTFKHSDFNSSPTMRSLVKVAQEKGWVKEEPLQKTAVPKVDLNPSNSFVDNLLKLCNGLRSSGFDKQADELESKLVQCKQAGALYDVGNEKGEDLVHAAHPKGSHKMENVDSKEATFEDILDKHMKMLDVANGQPTGKHSSAQDILKTVKRVLAQAAPADPNTGLTQPVVTNIMSYFKSVDESFRSLGANIVGANSDGLVAYNRLKSQTMKFINNQSINNNTISQILSMINDAITGLSTREFSKLFILGTNDAVFYLNGLRNYVNDTVVDDHKALAASATSDKPNDNGQQFTSQINSYLDLLKSWPITINNDSENSDADKAQANAWITDRTNELNGLLKQFTDITDLNEKNQKAPGFLGALNKSRFVRESAQFKKTWIG